MWAGTTLCPALGENRSSGRLEPSEKGPYSEDIPAQILIVDHTLEPIPNHRSIDDDLSQIISREFEENILEEGAHHSMETPSTYILHPLIHLRRYPIDLTDTILSEVEGRTVSRNEFLILAEESMPMFAEDTHKVLLTERTQLDPDRETTLELRDQIRGFRYMESTSSDEENMIGANYPIFRLDSTPLDDR